MKRGLGASIGPYRLIRELGRGGMGVVYEAIHEPLGQRVALKVIARALAEADRQAIRRFHNEAQALRSVQHEGLVHLYEVGALPEGMPYLAMELLTGETLRSRLARVGRLPVDEGLHLGIQVAEALSAVHRAGILHRDVKPSNIMLVRDPAGHERARLLDFGLARQSDHTESLTASGAVVGTPSYMAPEQEGGQVLGRPVDVYALGVVLYETLSGQRPLQPEPAPLRRLVEGVPEPLSVLLQRMLGAGPAMRPTLDEVLSVLRLLASAGATAVPSPSFHRGSWTYAADGLIAVLLLAALAYVLTGLMPNA